jgi:hypothetical protein
MLQRDGMVMVEMKVLVMEMMMMMIPMKSGAMVMTMAMISPLWEGISSADFCLLESFSLSSVFHPAEAAVSISEPPLTLVFGDNEIHEGAMAEVGQGGHTIGRCSQGSGRAPCVCACPVAPLASSFWLLQSSGKYNFLVFF